MGHSFEVTLLWVTFEVTLKSVFKSPFLKSLWSQFSSHLFWSHFEVSLALKSPLKSHCFEVSLKSPTFKVTFKITLKLHCLTALLLSCAGWKFTCMLKKNFIQNFLANGHIHLKFILHYLRTCCFIFDCCFSLE